MTQFKALSPCFVALIVALGAPGLSPSHAQKADITGIWMDHTGRGAVEFSRCGQALCGSLVWLDKPTDEKGLPFRDGNNPDAKLRNRPICGLPIIGAATPTEPGTYDGGWIYNPEDGKSYKVEVKLVSPNVATVKGYLGVKFLGQTFTWKRAPASLTKCSDLAACDVCRHGGA
jgi:uncharacterized protein (DUF2147 family)